MDGPKKFLPHLIKHPISLLAVLLSILGYVEKIVLQAALNTNSTSWQSGILYVFAVLWPIIIIIVIFLLLVKYRVHIGGDDLVKYALQEGQRIKELKEKAKNKTKDFKGNKV